MAKYWIKLYHEILKDPKMGRMPDRLFRRTIELFLLAGSEDDDGHLPAVDDMAWVLHLDPAELQSDLEAIQETGIVGMDEDGWMVAKFAERQDADTNAERVSRYREAKRIETQSVTNRYSPVTNGVTNVVRELEKNRIELELESNPNTLAVFFETKSGYPVVPNSDNVNTINAWERDGIIEQDIEDAIAFYSSNSRTARSPFQIDKSVRTAHAKRVQADSQAVKAQEPIATEVYR